MASELPEVAVSDQTYRYFVQEASDLLGTMERELQDLRANFSLQKVHALMRAAHTLKGAAASVGLETLKKTTHSLEGIFKALCYPDTVVSVETERLIFEGYDCLRLLMASQLAESQVDEADVLDRMAAVAMRLEEILGDRFGREGYLPTSSELGFDMTHSIFEMGVAQRINALAEALDRGDPEEVAELLQTYCEVFAGLGESLDLPGFEEIANAAERALRQYPQRVLEIALVALENFRAAQKLVLAGDRTYGGRPSAALQQFCDVADLSADRQGRGRQNGDSQSGGLSSAALPATDAATQRATQPHRDMETDDERAAAQSRQHSWLKRRWQMLMNPLGKRRSDRLESSEDSSRSTQDARNRLEPDISRARLKTDGAAISNEPLSVPLESLSLTLDSAEGVSDDLLDLAPAELEVLNVAPQFGERSGDSQTVREIDGERSGDDPYEEGLETFWELEGSAAGAALAESTSGATIRMSVEHIEQISQSMGELLTQQNRQRLYQEQLTVLVKQLLNRISQQQQQLSRQQDQQAIHRSYLAESSGSATAEDSERRGSFYDRFDWIELDRYSDVQRLLQSCIEETVQQSESAEAIELFLRRSRQSLERQQRLLSNTRETLLEARMVPLKSVFERFVPTVQRLQAESDKQIRVTTLGDDILVDKAIADSLFDPLLHLVRNAFDHGIEPLAQRLAAGKSPAGHLRVEGVQQGRCLLIRVRDDGRGLDLERICAKAVESGLVTRAAAAGLSAEQTVDLLFEPGFSTAGEVDAISGRGVGLDVVQASLRSLQGWVSVDHTLGQGVCFTLQVPASLTMAKLLLCQAQGRTYALIADAIEHILIPSGRQVRCWKGGKMLTWQMNREEYLVPVNALDEVLHYASPMSERHLGAERAQEDVSANPVVLLRHQDTLVGLEVDRLLGEQELAISPLGQTIVPPAYLYGSSTLPDGQLTLVLDGLILAKIIVEQRQHNLAAGAASQSVEPVVPADKPVFSKPMVLTVDDSITVRNTLTEALQRANYEVVQARDGAEALEQLKRYPDVQAILCDLEMPGMNGFEFLRARQRDEAISMIPTIMLTSRAGEKHRLLTEELGASAYVTKPYLTPKLLEAVAEAIEAQARPLVNAVGDIHEQP